MIRIHEQLYSFSPPWAQSVAVSLYGLFWRHRRFGGNSERYVTEFREREQWGTARMHEYLVEQVRQALVSAYQHVPYYRRRWEQRGITELDLSRMELENLQQLPVTPKQDLRQDPESFVNAEIARQHRLRRDYSSGTTGTPITAILTTEAHRRFIAAREARSFGWAGTSIRNPRSMIGGRMVVSKAVAKAPFHRYNRFEKQVYFSAYHISPANVPSYVAALHSYRPRVFTGYAYSHYLLAKMMLEQGLTLQYEPDALVLSSEKLTREMKEVIQQAFRARAYEEYGCVENCVLATECGHGRLHVNPDFGIVEIVDGDDRPVPPGVEGRILCTSLLNPVQPLIRYEIGDLAAWSAEACPCGRDHLPVLQEIVGRLEDVVTGPDGRQLVRFHGIFLGLGNVLEGQVIQEERDRFTVKVVPSNGFGEREEHLIRKRFEERLGHVNVRVEKVTDIPRTDRGKFRAVISKVNADRSR